MTTRLSEVTTRKPQSSWPWLKIAAATLILLVVGAAWDRHRRTQQPAAPPIVEPAPPVQQAPEAAEPAEPRTQQASEPPPIAKVARDRPSRDRGSRPGDAQDEQASGAVVREFRSADRDGDGFLSHDEVRGRFPVIDREFDRVDADGDGRISQQEFWRLRQRQAEMKRSRSKY